MPTTSHRPRPSTGSGGGARGRVAQAGSPVESFRLLITISGVRHGEFLARQAIEKGLEVEARSDERSISLEFEVDTAEDALERLALIADLLSPKKG